MKILASMDRPIPISENEIHRREMHTNVFDEVKNCFCFFSRHSTVDIYDEPVVINISVTLTGSFNHRRSVASLFLVRPLALHHPFRLANLLAFGNPLRTTETPWIDLSTEVKHKERLDI
jgi:hypothetical protein